MDHRSLSCEWAVNTDEAPHGPGNETAGVARPHRLVLERRSMATIAAVGLAYTVVASLTRPFTGAADIVTAVPLAFAVVVRVWSARRPAPSLLDAPAGAGPAAVPPRGRGWLFWMAILLATAGWELYCYAQLPRASHPTLSSLLDIVDSTHVGKAVAFGAWLVLGWALVVT